MPGQKTSTGDAQELKAHTDTAHTRYSPAGRSYLPVRPQQCDTVLFTDIEDTAAKSVITDVYPDAANVSVAWAERPAIGVLPGTGCWCTAAVKTRGAFPDWWPVGPSAAAPSGWGCPAGREPRPRRRTSWTKSLLKRGLRTAAAPLRWNSLWGRNNSNYNGVKWSSQSTGTKIHLHTADNSISKAELPSMVEGSSVATISPWPFWFL